MRNSQVRWRRHAERLRAASRFGGAPTRTTLGAYTTYLATRPAAAEDAAIDLLIRLCRECGVRTHVVHTRVCRRRGLRRSGTEPMACRSPSRPARTISGSRRTRSRTAPPPTSARRQFAIGATPRDIWAALKADVIESVVTDHSPAPPDLKEIDSGNFLTAWGGIASLQLRLPIVWTEARERGVPLEKAVSWLSAAPARLAGLARKGAIEVGRDADLAIFDPDAEFNVDPAALFHRHRVTPYAGQRLTGIVRRTYLRGRRVYEEGEPFGSARGDLLLRQDS